VKVAASWFADLLSDALARGPPTRAGASNALPPPGLAIELQLDSPNEEPAIRAERGNTGMIRVTRLDHSPIILNAELIEQIEETPDTVITLTNGQTLMVGETAAEIVARAIEYKRAVSAQFQQHCRKSVNRDPGAQESGTYLIRGAEHGR
jgi:flagellar protein FlbD